MNNHSINDSNTAILYMTVLLEYINQIICNFPVMPHWEPHDTNTICDRICEKVPFSHTKFDPFYEL